MNVESIKRGQVIKNYKELCKLLDLRDKKGGNARISQMKEIERFLKLRKQGYKFIVDEVYSEPLPKIDGRINNGGNNTKYEDLFDKVIINTLIDYGGFIEESYSSLLENYFDFFTTEYSKLYELGSKRYAEVNNMSKGLVMTYQQKIRYVVKTALETSLSRLQRNNIIKYKENIIIRNDDFKEVYADDKMRSAIRFVEQKVYEEMTMANNGKKITPFSRVINPRMNDQFKRKATDYLNIYSYWKVYSIELIDKNTKHVKDDSDELKRRFIKSVVENVKNSNSKDKLSGTTFKPYSYPKFQNDIDKLTKMIWKLPEDYTTETEIKQLLTSAEVERQTTTDEELFNIDGYEEYYQLDDVPF